MEHIRLVEAVERDRMAAFADVDVGRLGKRVQELVRGVRGKHGRALVFRGVAAHGEMVRVHRVEPGIAVPCLVHVDHVHGMIELGLDLRAVVAEAVVGAVRDDRVGGAAALRRDRARGDLFPDRFGRHLRTMDRPDDAVTVAGRDHVDRGGSGQDQALFDGFVAVAVADGHVGVGQHALDDGAVAAGGADDHGIRPVRAERLRGERLALLERALVVEQGPDAAAFDPGVRAEEIFAVEVEEFLAFGRLGEADAALVAGRGPGVFVMRLVVVPDRPHERREQIGAPALDGRLDAPGDELRTVLEDPDELVGERHERFAEVAAGSSAVGEQEDRDARLTFADMSQEIERTAFGGLLEFHVGGDEKRVEVHVCGGDRERLAHALRILDCDVTVGERVGKAHNGVVQSAAGFGKEVLHDEDLSGLKFGIVHICALLFRLG